MLPLTKTYLVTSTDYFGNDYQHTVSLTDKEARSRIVDGRLLSKAEGEARDYGRLWQWFKSQNRYETAGRMPTENENKLIDYKNQNHIV